MEKNMTAHVWNMDENKITCENQDETKGKNCKEIWCLPF